MHTHAEYYAFEIQRSEITSMKYAYIQANDENDEGMVFLFHFDCAFCMNAAQLAIRHPCPDIITRDEKIAHTHTHF